jgi:hypothetical protein
MPLLTWRRNPARNARSHRPAVKISWPHVGLPDPPERPVPSIEEIRQQCLTLSTHGLTYTTTSAPEPAKKPSLSRLRPAGTRPGSGRRKAAA